MTFQMDPASFLSPLSSITSLNPASQPATSHSVCAQSSKVLLGHLHLNNRGLPQAPQPLGQFQSPEASSEAWDPEPRYSGHTLEDANKSEGGEGLGRTPQFFPPDSLMTYSSKKDSSEGRGRTSREQTALLVF